MASKETRLELVESGARWANNILVELINNHGSVLNTEAREHFRQAVRSLGDAIVAIRFPSATSKTLR